MPPSFDLAHVAYRIQYIPQEETPQEDQELKPATPTALSAEGGELSIIVRVTPGAPLEPTDVIEVFASITNVRGDSERVAWGRVTDFTVNLPSGGTRYFWTRIRREIDGPDVFSEFLPASATDGVSQTALDFAGELPSHSGVFLDTFEHQDLARFYNLRASTTPTVTFPANGENGAHVIRMQNYGWIAWRQNIPYDPSALYLMTVRARQTTAGTAGANEGIWLGVEGVAADGTTLINVGGADSSGSQHYFAAAGFDLGAGASIGTWQTFRGYLSGLGTPDGIAHPDPADPEVAYSSGATVVKFIRPLAIVNYSGGTGTAEIDYIRIDRVWDETHISPNAATVPLAATDAGPINIDLTAPATNAIFQQVKYVTVTTVGTYDFEISASFRLGVTGNPGSFTVTTMPAVWDNGTTLQAAVQGVDRTTNLIEPLSITGLISRPAGTYRVGIACTIAGDGVNNFTAGYRDINLRVTVIKR